MIYVKINSANHSTYREIEGNTFDFYKIYISYPREREGFSPEGYSGRVQHFEIGIRTEVEKVELEFDYYFAVLEKEDKTRWFDSRPKQIGYIDFELYSPTSIIKLNKDGLEDYFRKEMYKKEKLFKKMEEINKRTTEMKQDFE